MTPRVTLKATYRAAHPIKKARSANAIPKTCPSTPPVSLAISTLATALEKKRAMEAKKKSEAKIVAPILCVVPLATHC